MAEATREINKSISMLGENRQQILQTKGMACVRVHTNKKYPNGYSRWLTQEPDTNRPDVTWYTDGTSSHPTCRDITRIGFGIVVVSDEGDLVVYGAGVPPAFVTDSGMAEAWAVWKAVELSPRQPRIVTDCLGILTTARDGTARATTGKKPNARIWNMLSQALDGDVTKLADTLTWMPAHQNTAAIGNRYRSDGRRLSSIDYRANRLVDKLATHFIKPEAQTRKGEKLYADVRAASITALATLGEVTWAANNCSIECIDENGNKVTKICRDSSSKPIKRSAKAKGEPMDEKSRNRAAKKDGKATEDFTDKELKAALNRCRKRKLASKKNKRLPKTEHPKVTEQEKVIKESADPGCFEKHVETLTMAAQASDSKYVSFSSFLAIGQSTMTDADLGNDANAQTEETTRSQREADTGANRRTEDSSESDGAKAKLTSMRIAQSNRIRTRRSKSNVTPWESKKSSQEAMLKLIGNATDKAVSKSEARGSQLARAAGDASKSAAKAEAPPANARVEEFVGVSERAKQCSAVSRNDATQNEPHPHG